MFLCYRKATRAENAAKRRELSLLVLQKRERVYSGGFREGQSMEGKRGS